jgi:hypothetical protein
MRFTRLVLALLVVLSFSALTSDLEAAKGSKGSGHSTKSAAPKAPHVKTTTAKTHERSAPKVSKPAKIKAQKRPRTSAVAVAHDDKGGIKRSEAARHAFEVKTGYPHGRPGYVIDHIKPLACGGADEPSNMQWQTIEAAKAKDRVERVGC